MADFKDLQVWQRARRLNARVYAISKRFPADEKQGVTSQIRRAMISIVANIAEGSGRYSPADQARCYRIALASSREVEALLIAAVDLEWLSDANSAPLLTEVNGVQRMLSGLINYCRRGKP